MRFFSSQDGTKDPEPNPESESGIALPEEKNTAAAEVKDVDNKGGFREELNTIKFLEWKLFIGFSFFVQNSNLLILFRSIL